MCDMANRPQDGSEPKVRDAVFLPPRLWQWLDAQRGTVSRSKYLAEMLKAQLERQDSRAVRAAGAIPAEEPAISEGRLPAVLVDRSRPPYDITPPALPEPQKGSVTRFPKPVIAQERVGRLTPHQMKAGVCAQCGKDTREDGVQFLNESCPGRQT